MRQVLLILVAPLLVSGLAQAVPSAVPQQDPGTNWTNWRGPNGTAIARTGNPPTQWSEEENIRWKVALPGLGSSSPIVWGDRIFVTTAIETDQDGSPPSAGGNRAGGSGRGGRGRGRFGGFGGFHGGAAPTKVYEFAVLALDRKDGKVRWATVVKKGVPHESGHQTNSQSSGSPITDGEHIYAHFGSRGLYCLNLDGEVQWSKDFGLMQTKLSFGEGMSPALHGDTLVVNWDHEGDSFIAAFDKKTGEELWRNPRDETTSWATPLIAPANGKMQVITTATSLSRSYDLQTGELVWTLGGMTANSIPSPIHVDGVAYLMSGFMGAKFQAVQLEGANGDLGGSESVLWSHDRETSYTPSALVYDDFIYFVSSNNGRLSCLDKTTGAVHYERQQLQLRTLYSSPVGAAGRVYLTSREGVTKVIKLGAEYEEIATNELDDGFDATMAIVGDEIYLRGRENLYCIAKTEKD